ncbi:MAG: efflux RND transporter periplasmic adaptor subunit [Verrucomicrobiota bacterium]
MTSPQPPLAPAANALTTAAHNPAPRLKVGRLALVAALLVLLAAAAGISPRWRQRAALRAETAELAVPNVLVTTPDPGKALVGPALPAEVKPFIESPIYARASGFLKRWLVDIGEKVRTGQLLAEIDTPELNQELARARAELAQAEAALELSKITAGRWADLLKTSSVSEQETAEKQSDLALKLATVEGARANVRRLEDLQSFSRVTAPFAGTITARRTDMGELIAAGSVKELFRLAQTGTLRVYVRVPQTSARNVLAGSVAEMSVPELPGRTIPAKVVRTSGVVDPQSRTMLTELEVDNASGDVLAGSYAQVRFPQAKAAAVLTLPSNCLLFRAEGSQVGVVLANGTVELRNVTVGRDFGPNVEVLGGVETSDQVIINPADSLVTGTRVRLVNPSESSSSAAKARQGKQ